MWVSSSNKMNLLNSDMKKFSFRTLLKMGKPIMLILLFTLFALILILIMGLWIYIPGKPKPFLDANGKLLVNSISEKIYININGVKQGMFIKGKDMRKPVLLYLHGGLPDYFLTQKYPTGFEEYFVVVWWEQRGAGMSYHTGNAPNTITPEQYVSDIITMTNYLRQRFNKEKIYLMGHSGGTFIGIQAAARAPQLYNAYIGAAQSSVQLKSEKLAYDYMLKCFKEKGNTKMVKNLEAAPVSMTAGIPKGYLALRDEAMHSLGIGTMHNMHSVFTGIFLQSLFFPEYTLSEKFNLWRAKSNSGVSILWNKMVSTDLSKVLLKLDVPVYFVHGIYDYTCSYTEAKSYFKQLKAPIKGFYTFEKSAHSPMFEEPEKLQRILKEDILLGATGLADKN
jgi:pimeloyl-ACP methyl ester carboxylesterase